MDNLAWAQELVAAPDLEAIGGVIDRRLQNYVAAGAPSNDRGLAERLAFENQTRHYIARANERGYAFSQAFEGFASRWVDFVDQNKTAEGELALLDRRQEYERGRTDATTAVAQGWGPTTALQPLPAPSTAPATSVVLSDAVHQTIDALIKVEVGKLVGARTVSAPAPAPASTAAPPLAPTPDADRPRLSEVLKLYLAPPGQKRRRKTKGRADTASVVQFAVDLLEDPVFDSITKTDWERLDEALTDIPHTKGLPANCRSLFKRYQFAQKRGWENLSRVSITTLEGGYHYGLRKFIKWAIGEKHYLGEVPQFVCIDEENTAALPRDAFEDDELIALVSLALFTGCAGTHRIWMPGKYYIQNSVHWAYLILALTGMRPGEVGQIVCQDIVTDGLGNWFFDLRPYNARKGRVKIKDLRNLKSNDAGRVVPVHPLLIELGLLDRMHELESIDEKRLFPDWEVFIRGDGTVRWSQPITKSWQHVKNYVLKIKRKDLTLYSLRHLAAEILDNSGIAQRTRDRILGHASGVPGRYGSNGPPKAGQVSAINAADPPVIQRMRAILLPAKQRADRGELTILKPWLRRAD